MEEKQKYATDVDSKFWKPITLVAHYHELTSFRSESSCWRSATTNMLFLQLATAKQIIRWRINMVDIPSIIVFIGNKLYKLHIRVVWNEAELDSNLSYLNCATITTTILFLEDALHIIIQIVRYEKKNISKTL